MWQHDTQGCTVRKGGGGKGEKSAWRNVFSLSRCVCFWVTTSANTSSLQNEWMKRGRKPQTICAFCPPSYLVNTGEWPSESRLRRVNPLNFFFFFFSPPTFWNRFEKKSTSRGMVIVEHVTWMVRSHTLYYLPVSLRLRGCRGITERMKQRFTWTGRGKTRPGLSPLRIPPLQAAPSSQSRHFT